MSIAQTAPRATRWSRLPVTLAIGLFQLGAITQDRWLFGPAAAAVAVAVAALLLCPRPSDLTVEHLPAGPAQVGVPFVQHLRLCAGGRRGSGPAHLRLREDGLVPRDVVVAPVRRGRPVVVRLERDVAARGLTTVAAVQCSMSAPLGLFVRRTELRTPWQLLRRPALVDVDPLDLRAAGDTSTSAIVSRTGADVHGVRELRPGDGPRDVHWRSSARRGQLVVLERERPRGGLVTLVVIGGSGDPDWEEQLAVAASHAVILLQDGVRLRLAVCVAGPAVLETADDEDALDWFARLGPSATPTADELAAVLEPAAGSDVLFVATGPLAAAATELMWRAAGPMGARPVRLLASDDG